MAVPGSGDISKSLFISVWTVLPTVTVSPFDTGTGLAVKLGLQETDPFTTTILASVTAARHEDVEYKINAENIKKDFPITPAQHLLHLRQRAEKQQETLS